LIFHTTVAFVIRVAFFLGCPDDAIDSDDAITIDARLYTCKNSRMSARIFMKFGMNIMPLVSDFLRSLIPTQPIVKYVRWEDDHTITHDLLRKHDDVIVRDVASILNDVCMKFSEKNTTGIMVYCLSSLC
jgi:hypothetical protein